MSNAPHFEIDVPTFWADPYPDFARIDLPLQISSTWS